MANSVKEIKRKIKSIKSTKQITKAMELVATSKMKKAVDNAVRLRAYGYLAFSILSRLSRKHSRLHSFFKQRKRKNILAVFFTTDKGLCGGLNSNLFKKMMKLLEKMKIDYPDANVAFAASGKKGAEFLRRMGKNVEFVFPAFSLNPKFSDTLAISRVAIKGFENGKYDEVVLVYPDFVSTLLQKPVSKVLLPFSVKTFSEMLEELGSKFHKVVKIKEKDVEYKLEPSPEYILKFVIPQLVEMQLYQAVLEAAASEHSARMVAMQNATQAATDLLDEFVFTYNQARQAAITAEIAEIASSSLILT
ncbi:ATP synthase F1 subunit gamma [Candidatus Peregrinibacteria bacterium]|nr:ATP synthase F1 subunit gamma [Candidatus Peregrinibacteria bacterium]